MPSRVQAELTALLQPRPDRQATQPRALRGGGAAPDATPEIGDELRRKGAQRVLTDMANVVQHAKTEQARTARTTRGGPLHGGLHRLDDPAFYPPHPPRTQTPQYTAIHNKLVHDQDLPCIVCKVTYSVISDSEKQKDSKLNPYGAARIETHHRIVEWALANAVDVDKFNNHLRGFLATHHPGDKYARPFNAQQILDWVDHDEDNLWVLCDVHHRHKYFGIHAISDPMWGPQDILTDDFLSDVRGAIVAAGGTITHEKPQLAKKAPGKKATKKKAATKRKKPKARRRR